MKTLSILIIILGSLYNLSMGQDLGPRTDREVSDNEITRLTVELKELKVLVRKLIAVNLTNQVLLAEFQSSKERMVKLENDLTAARDHLALTEDSIDQSAARLKILEERRSNEPDKLRRTEVDEAIASIEIEKSQQLATRERTVARIFELTTSADLERVRLAQLRSRIDDEQRMINDLLR